MTADKVIDASALAAAAFRESRATEVTLELGNETLHAPALLWFELSHVCIKKVRERATEREAILSQFAAALQLPIRLAAVDHEGVVALAEQHNLSAYDASYLWLARSLGVELVTLDDKLNKAAAKL